MGSIATELQGAAPGRPAPACSRAGRAPSLALTLSHSLSVEIPAHARLFHRLPAQLLSQFPGTPLVWRVPPAPVDEPRRDGI